MYTVEQKTGRYINGVYVPSGIYYLRKFQGAGTASVLESDQTWTSKDWAQLAADRANEGNTEDLTFSVFADD